MDFQELVDLAEMLQLTPSDLDEPIRDVFSQRITTLHELGVEEQVHFFLDEHGAEGAEEVIRRAAAARRWDEIVATQRAVLNNPTIETPAALGPPSLP